MSELSIYPIRQLLFECVGCKAHWMIRAEPPIQNIQELTSFTSDPTKMEGCPKRCGANKVNMAFRIPGPPTTEPASDPFSVFEEKK